ncbi:OsmC family protein [Oceanospirillum maris]|uniref:OsmC family protein n=1 Tax=Oceanospirillum maris TaxID=64977 RepID=UPI000406AC82|nr:OsmC family protein [Oceanospirillum maris]
MKAVVKWTDGVQFVAESGSGHAIIVDGPPEKGGRNTGPRPMELLLMGLGSCSSFDVIGILQKSRQDIIDCHVEVEAERVDAVPALFTKIHLHFVVTGRGVKEAHVKRAVELSAEKYCSASIMLAAGGVEISHDYEIIEQP